MLGLFVRPSQKGGFYRTFLVHFFHKKGSKCEIFAPPQKKPIFGVRFLIFLNFLLFANQFLPAIVGKRALFRFGGQKMVKIVPRAYHRTCGRPKPQSSVFCHFWPFLGKKVG